MIRKLSVCERNKRNSKNDVHMVAQMNGCEVEKRLGKMQ